MSGEQVERRLAAREQVRDKLDFSFEDMGEQQVKNIARPVRTHRIVIGRPLSQSPLPLLPQRSPRSPKSRRLDHSENPPRSASATTSRALCSTRTMTTASARGL